MACVKCGTATPSFATVCSGCTRDIYTDSNGPSVGIFDGRNLFFFACVALLILISKIFS